MNEKYNLLQIVDRLCFVVSCLILAWIAVWGIGGRIVGTALPVWAAKWALPVLTAAAVGYLTNCLAITLLFRPYRPVKLLHGLQGIVPREQGSLAKRLGEEIPATLLPPEELAAQVSRMVSDYLHDPALTDSVRQKVCFYVRHRKEQIAEQLTPHLLSAAGAGADAFLTPERVRTFYVEYGSGLIQKQIGSSGLTEMILTELKNRVPEITAAVKRFVRCGAENYVQNEYPKLSRWIHADRFAAQMVMRLNWELIQSKIGESLTAPSARGMVRSELTALEERLKTYVLSEEMESDLARLKNVYAAEAASVCKAILTENLPRWLEDTLAQDEVWQVVQNEILPAVHGFLLHQIKRNQENLAAGLDLPGRIEKAILGQKPEDIHALVNRVSGEHLVALQLLGFLLGGIAGCLLVIAQW